jgi:phage shock protein A
VITSSMKDAKNDLVEDVIDEAGEPQLDDEDEALEGKLAELSEIMARITDEVEQFAQLEKRRKAATSLSEAIPANGSAMASFEDSRSSGLTVTDPSVG